MSIFDREKSRWRERFSIGDQKIIPVASQKANTKCQRLIFSCLNAYLKTLFSTPFVTFVSLEMSHFQFGPSHLRCPIPFQDNVRAIIVQVVGVIVGHIPFLTLSMWLNTI